MKNLLLFSCLVFLLPLNSTAQTNVQWVIHHKLGNADFAMNTSSQNNLGNPFNVSRLEYYISEISLIHDGGIETTVPDLYVLVDANEATTIDLGDLPVTELERVNFHIGVDPDHNHLDPSSYPNGHPLAPQFPSMHWGWAAGYRFVAYEGKGGQDLNQTFQLHALGDDNYFQTGVDLSLTAENNSLLIEMDADYSAALESVDVSGGLIVHGDFGAAQITLENFRDYVFGPVSVVNSATEIASVQDFMVFPNPSPSGSLSIQLTAIAGPNFQIAVMDLFGRRLQTFNAVTGQSVYPIHLPKPGLYLINLLENGKPVSSQKVHFQ